MPIDFTPDAEESSPQAPPQSSSMPKIAFSPDPPETTLSSATKNPPSGFGVPSDPDSLEYKAMTGTINPVSYAMQKTRDAGNTIGSGVWNIATALPKAAWSLATLADQTTTPPEIQNAMDSAEKYTSGAIKSGVDYLKNTAIGKSVSDWSAAHPEATEDIEAIPGMFGAAAPINGLSKFVSSAAPVWANAAKYDKPGFISNVLTTPEEHAQNFWQNRATPEQAKHVSAIKYDVADRVGGALSSDKRNEFIDAAAGADKGPDGKIVPPSPLAQKILENLNATRDQPLTLRGAQNIEQDINANISYQPNGMLTPDSVQLLKIKQALRSTINSAVPKDMVGGVAGWEAWQDAKKAYSATGILTDLKNMINKSTYAAQPGTQLKNNLARWSNKSSATAGLDLNEMDLVKDAIKTDFAHEMLRTGSSRLVPIASTALGLGTGHGFLGATAGTIAGMGGRNLAFARQLGKIGELADAIGERLPDMTKAEPPSPSRALVPVGPVVNHMTDEQIAHAQAKMRAAGNRSTPLSGGAVTPPIHQGMTTRPGDLGFSNPGGSLPGPAGFSQEPHPSAGGFSVAVHGKPTKYPVPKQEIVPNPDPFSPNPAPPEPTDIMKDFFKNKASGGAVKNKMGFKLKSKKK